MNHRFPLSRSLAVNALLAIVLSACNAGVESFDMHVEIDGTPKPVELRDLGRRPAGRENVVSAGESRRYIFRVMDQVAVDAGGPVGLVVELGGQWSGGALVMHRADESRMVEFDSILEWQRSESSPPVALAIATDRIPPRDTEFEFRAPPAGAYQVRSLRVASDPPQVVISPTPRGDARLPVQVDDSAVTISGLDAIIREPDDGLILRYRAPTSLFEDPAFRPTFLVEFERDDGSSEPLAVRARPGENRVVIRPRRWGVDPARVRIVTNDSGVEFVALEPIAPVDDPSVPIPIELSELLGRGRDGWRRDEFELYSWSLFPRQLWFDTRDYGVQAAMFKRLAFFVEKRGFRGTLLTNEELASRHGWNAHNYRPEGLVQFFNAASAEEFILNPIEIELRDLLEVNGIILRSGDGGWIAGTGGVLVVSQESNLELRRLLIAHEAMHGVFYESPVFVDQVETYWNGVLSERERAFWREFLAWASYDPADEYLMVNEFQGYLLQQPIEGVRWYFRTRVADRLRAGRPDRARRVDAFLSDYPRTFVDSAAAMNDALFGATGIVGGDPFCVVPMGTEG